MSYIRSPMNYTGGKYKLLNTIIQAFPEKVDKFVDLFCSGLNVGINVNADTVICLTKLYLKIIRLIVFFAMLMLMFITGLLTA